MYEQRSYLIFSVNQLSQVDFSQVLETSAETVRLSANGLKTFVKWDGDTPSSIEQLTDTEGPYTYAEILEILATEEWSIPTPTEL